MAKNIKDIQSARTRLHEEILQIAEEHSDIIAAADENKQRWHDVFPDGMLLELCQEFECCPALVFIALETLNDGKCPDIHSVPVLMCDIETCDVIQSFQSMTQAARYIQEELSDTSSVQSLHRAITKRSGIIYGYHWVRDVHASLMLDQIKYNLICCSGIYKIHNKMTEQDYIGQTRQKFYARWTAHKHNISSNKHTFLYESMRQYGIDSFDFSIIEIIKNPDRKTLYHREQYWIDYYKTLSSFGGLNYTRPTWQRKADQYDIDMIYEYLLLGLYNKEIEQITGASCGLISRIRSGQSYRRDGINYPILSRREQKLVEQYKQILTLLEETTLDFTSIGKLVGIHAASVSNIYHKKFPQLLVRYFGESFSFQNRERIINVSQQSGLKEKKETRKIQHLCHHCGSVFYGKKGQKYCSQDCYSAEQAKNCPNRDTLKNEIRIHSFSTLSKKYGISDNAIRKWCKKYNLPSKSYEIKQYTDKEWENEIWCDLNNTRNQIVQSKDDYAKLLQSFVLTRDRRIVICNAKNANIVHYALAKYHFHMPSISHCSSTCYLKEHNLYFRSAEDAAKWVLSNTENANTSHCSFAKNLTTQFKTSPTATLTLPDPTTGSPSTFTFAHVPEDEFYEVIQHHHVVSYAFDPKWASIVEDPSVLPDFVSLDELPWVEEFKAFYRMQ